MENEKTKITIIIVSIIILISLAVILTIKLVDIKKNKENILTINTNTIIEIENEVNNNVINEAIQNNTVENSINEIVENNVTENIVTDNTISSSSNQQISKEEIDNETIQKEEDSKEKAINIVKENWGEDDKVYFSFDSIDSNGKYIVSVRDRVSTEALYWYTVDIEKGTFSIE